MAGKADKYKAGDAEVGVTQSHSDPTAGFFNKFRFGWMNAHVKAARKGDLDVEEMHMPHENYCQESYRRFAGNWAAELKLREQDKQPSLIRALRKTFGAEYMVAGFFKFLWSVFVITGAFYFVRSLLAHVNEVNAPVASGGRLYGREWVGWVLAAFFFVDAWFLGLSLQRMGYICMQVGIRVRGALVQCVAQKAFRLNRVSQEQAAKIVNFVSSDIQKVFDGALEFHYLWTAPIEAVAILALLAYLTKDSMLPGLGVILLIVPLQYFFGYKIIRIKLEWAKHAAKRSGTLQEVLPAIKLVKYYAWERFFEHKINEARKLEMKLAFWNAVMKVINVACVFCVPPMTAFVIFTNYEFNRARLISTVAFTTLSLFNILRFPLVVLPKALRAVSECYSSLTRLEEYLLEDVAQAKGLITEHEKHTPGVNIDNGTFHHPTNPNWKLHIPKFSVRPGEVVAVVGRIGAGKTSLIAAVLGQMNKDHGNMTVGGSISYVPQDPWLQNMSLRDNVMFGEAMDADRYDAVIEACALTLDLQILPQGDRSKAGVRGVNFSGGQRQRVNLARCAYAEGDLVLLDNAMSAVDHHTAHHIFDKCIKGLFAHKAVILVTHQLEFMPKCDNVAIMDEGKCIYFGKWNPEAQELLGRLLPVSHLLHSAGAAEQPRDPPPKKKKEDVKSLASGGSYNLAPTSIGAPAKKDQGPNNKLTSSQAFWIYVYNANLIIVCGIIFFYLAPQTTRQVSDFWVRWWVDDKHDQFSYTKDAKGKKTVVYPDDTATKMYSLYYLLLVGIFYVTMLGRGSFFFWGVLGSAERMRRRALHKVLNAPMGFFLVTPVGDLLINFSKDQDILDENLPDAMHFAGIYGLILISTTITVSVTINFFAAFTGALLIASAIVLSLYLPAATALKKARAVTSGSLVGLVSETLEGLNVIQAFGKQDYFINEAARRTDAANRAVYNGESLNLWLAFWCDLIGALLVLAVACFAVGTKDTLGPATIGLAFSNVIQMLVFYTWVVRFIAESISLFNSVESIAYLADYVPPDGVFYDSRALDGQAKTIIEPDGDIVPVEKKIKVVIEDTAHANWPTNGVIKFEDVWMQYRLDAPWALKGVSYTLNDGEKVGVVGRTGSGKSTMLLALYRMFELGKGRILIDNVDIATLPMQRLRRGLSIIPQEPVIFSGTVRENLDPFKEFSSDDVLWEAIKKAGLESAVQHAGGLEGFLDAKGWSLGQTQLMCLARAALRAVPILCLDEATAAMDPHSEAIVQDTIKRVFSDRTTITIAHRLDTVIESDQVIVMEAGVLKEMAPPSQLLSDPNTMFSKLVDKTGPAAAAALRKMASDYYASKNAGAKQ